MTEQKPLIDVNLALAVEWSLTLVIGLLLVYLVMRLAKKRGIGSYTWWKDDDGFLALREADAPAAPAPPTGS